MPALHTDRPPTAALGGCAPTAGRQAPPRRAYPWRGAPPAHPDAPIPLCAGCGFLVTAGAHYYACEWPAPRGRAPEGTR